VTAQGRDDVLGEVVADVRGEHLVGGPLEKRERRGVGVDV
jgi:hypothetical protein